MQQLRALLSRRAAAPGGADQGPAEGPGGEREEDKARLPVDQSRVPVAERALVLVDRDYAVKREELELKRAGKRGEIEATRIELANRELERELAEIRAPIDGVVIKGDVKLGDLLEPGKPVLEMARQEGFRLRGLGRRARRSATWRSGMRGADQAGRLQLPAVRHRSAARSASSRRTRRRGGDRADGRPIP